MDRNQNYMPGLENNTINEEEQLKILRKEYNQLNDYYGKLSKEEREKEEEEVSKENSTCPRCEGTNVTDKIKRIQGNLKGSIKGASFFGCGAIRGDIHGELDTNEILYCNDCGNEWKITKNKYGYAKSALFDMFGDYQNYFNNKKKAEHIKFNPKDLSEKFFSLEEKKASILEEAEKYYNRPSILRGYHVETVSQFLKKKHYALHSFMREIVNWPECRLEEWGCKVFEKQKGFFSMIGDLIKKD